MAADFTTSPVVTVWPEWSEQDVLSEKWDPQGILAQSSKSTKDPKSRSFFEDPEGRVRLPQSLSAMVRDWKRPQELFGENLCVVRNATRINLKEANQHIMHSEFIRHLVSYVAMVWFMAQRKRVSQKSSNSLTGAEKTTIPPPVLPEIKSNSGTSKLNIAGRDATASKISQPEPPAKPACFEDVLADWAPWNLIFGGPPASAKNAAKGEPTGQNPSTGLPQYSPSGKYAVRLHWMGSWRKVLVDDFVPVDDRNRILLPVSTDTTEIWSIILAKAVLKVVSMDFGGGLASSETGDPTFILHTLTGWVPYVIYLDHPQSTRKQMWNKLQALMAVNRKTPPGDILSALALNWDIRNPEAFKQWRLENHPLNLEKIEAIRQERFISGSSGLPAVPVLPVGAPPSASSSLAPKGAGRGASAAPRKTENTSPSTLAVAQTAVKNQEAPKQAKVHKTPEVFLMATYRSAHHESKIFDRYAKSRSEKLYSAGFLRSESHPVLLRHLRDIQPQRSKQSLVPRYKLFRPLKTEMHRYTQAEADVYRVRRHSIRCVEFLSLFWREKGRLIHQTKSRAKKLMAEVQTCNVDLIRHKPTTGFRMGLPAIPEGSPYPYPKPEPKKIEPLPAVIPPTPPIHEEKEKPKGKAAESVNKLANAPVAEPLAPPVPPLLPAQNSEEVQKFSRLNFGSMEFNQFYESFEAIYVICKPETFDHVSTFSFFQPHVLSDGRPMTTKKKGAEPTPQQSANTVESSRGTPNKQVANVVPGHYGRVPVELPSPYMIFDNPYPTNVVICASSVFKWPYAPKAPDAKSQERMSVSPGLDEPKGKQDKPPPMVVTVRSHNWLNMSVTPALFTMKTSSVQGACYHVPAGRHVWKLKISCPGRRETEPLGFSIRVVSKDPVQIGAEEHVLKFAAADSYQFSVMSRKVLQSLLRWWKANGNPNYTNPPHREIISMLGLDDDTTSKTSRLTFFYAMARAVYAAVQLYFRDLCTPRHSMALRALFGDITSPLVLKFVTVVRRDSKVAAPVVAALPKPESHTSGRATETMKRKGKNAEKESKREPTPKEDKHAIQKALQEKEKAEMLAKFKDTPDVHRALLKWKMFFCLVRSKAVREMRRHGSKRKEATLKASQEILDAILKNEQSFALCFLRNLCRQLPPEWLDLGFFSNQETRCIFKDFPGSHPEIPAGSWKLLFRDTFTVSEDMLMMLRLTINVAPCRLTVINNDTGQPLPSVFFIPLAHFYTRNEAGYSVVAEAKAGALGWKSGVWTLRVIQELDPLRHEASQAETLLIRFPSSTLQTVFTTKELSDYFLPEAKSAVIGRVVLKKKLPAVITVYFSTSDADVLVELSIMRRGVPLLRTCGRGLVIIPAFYLKEDSQTDPYVIHATCLENSWSLTGEDWKFAFNEKLRRSAVEYGRETPVPTPTTSPAKITKEPASRKGRAAKEKEKLEEKEKETLDSARSAKTKEKEKEKAFDSSRPHWTMKFLLDQNDPDFEFKRDTEEDDLLRTDLLAAVASDPTILQRGKDFREDYLKRSASTGFLPADANGYPGWTSRSTVSAWPKPFQQVPLSFDLSTFTRKGSGSGEEVDLFRQQSMLAALQDRYNAALDKRAEAIIAERKSREEEINKQSVMLRGNLDVTIKERREYAEKREEFKKLMEEEEGRVGLLAVAEAKPKVVEKKKKKK